MQFCPIVSIVIPVYNGSNYLKEAIDSALAQTYKNIEIIVVNDGSNDDGATMKIARSHGDKIRYFEKPNGGVASALNLGIQQMRGEYFSWLSHDDLYYPNKIEDQIRMIEEIGSNAIIYSDFNLIDEKGSILSVSNLPHIDPSRFMFWLTLESRLHGCTLLIPKQAFSSLGKFDENLLTTQDYDLWFRFSSLYQFIHQPKVLISSRQHGNQTTRRMTEQVEKECNDLMLRFYLSFNQLKDSEKIILANSFYKRGFYIAAYYAFKDFIKSRSLMRSLINPSLLFRTLSSYLKATSDQQKKKNESSTIINIKSRFTSFYFSNTFGSKESKSGEGSTLEQTQIIRQELPKLFTNYNISIFLDAPCGDFNWMRLVDMKSIDKYYGIDIVEKVIENNNDKFNDSKKEFICLDIIKDGIPTGDLVLCRDCLVHLNYNDSMQALKNFKKANIKYLLVTTFIDREQNNDLTSSTIWRPLNMNRPPFNFPDPLELINEGCTEAEGKFKDKSLALYKLSDIIIE